MEIPKQIIDLIPTTTARAELFTEIDTLLKSIYRSGSNDFAHALEKDVRSETAKALQAYLTKKQTPQQIETTLADLKTALLKLPLLHLSLAVEPSAAGLEKIAAKARSYFGEQVILDIVVDPRLLGGSEISFNGRYADLSLRTKMDEYFAKTKNVRLKI